MTAKRVVVVTPAYNEERTIVEVIRGLKQRGFTTLIVVDDGSSDRTGALARAEGAIRLRHLLNRGLGGALGTGISAALRLGFESGPWCLGSAENSRRRALRDRVANNQRPPVLSAPGVPVV